MLGDYIGTVRRNHALEHATVTLLLNRLGPDLRLAGRATGDGFWLYGDLPTTAITECAYDGLARLKRGEGFWAVTPLCGTNLATAGILSSLAMLTVMGNSGKRMDSLPNMMLAGIVGVTIAQPVGRLIQKHITTSPDLDGFEIIDVVRKGKGNLHKVRTQHP